MAHTSWSHHWQKFPEMIDMPGIAHYNLECLPLTLCWIPNVHVLATNEEMVAHMRIANWKAPIYNVSGLSYGKAEACTVLLKWNTQDKVSQPYLEALAVTTLDWNL